MCLELSILFSKKQNKVSGNESYTAVKVGQTEKPHTEMYSVIRW